MKPSGQSPSHEAVHFTLASSTAVGGKSESVRAEGDCHSRRGENDTAHYLAADAVPVEVIAIGGDVYNRSSATAGAWRKGNTEPPPPKPRTSPTTSILPAARAISARRLSVMDEKPGMFRLTWTRKRLSTRL